MMTQLKPFNPILGETFQAKIGENTFIYVEQTSHHPPIYNFLLENTKKKYRMTGFEEISASTGTNSITARSYGKFIIEFSDINNEKSKFRLTTPIVKIGGTLYGDRTFEITDHYTPKT